MCSAGSSGSFLPGQCSEHWLGACRHYLWIACSFDIWSNVQSLTPYSFQVNLCCREHTDIKSYWLGSRTSGKPSKMTVAAALTTTCLLLRRRLFLTKEAMRARVQQDSAGVGGRRRASPFGPRAGAWRAYPPPARETGAPSPAGALLYRVSCRHLALISYRWRFAIAGGSLALARREQDLHCKPRPLQRGGRSAAWVRHARFRSKRGRLAQVARVGLSLRRAS